MRWLSEDLANLHALYINQLRILLSAEEQIVRAIPVMITYATHEQLRQAFRSHLKETEVHVKRLEEILAGEKSIDPKVDDVAPIKCKAVAALVKQTEETIATAPHAWVRDAALIAAAQCIEHYEIASYGTVRQWALVLGENMSAEILDSTLKEEGHADQLLSSLAECVNPQAKAV